MSGARSGGQQRYSNLHSKALDSRLIYSTSENQGFFFLLDCRFGTYFLARWTQCCWCRCHSAGCWFCRMVLSSLRARTTRHDAARRRVSSDPLCLLAKIEANNQCHTGCTRSNIPGSTKASPKPSTTKRTFPLPLSYPLSYLHQAFLTNLFNPQSPPRLPSLPRSLLLLPLPSPHPLARPRRANPHRRRNESHGRRKRIRHRAQRRRRARQAPRQTQRLHPQALQKPRGRARSQQWRLATRSKLDSQGEARGLQLHLQFADRLSRGAAARGNGGVWPQFQPLLPRHRYSNGPCALRRPGRIRRRYASPLLHK